MDIKNSAIKTIIVLVLLSLSGLLYAESTARQRVSDLAASYCELLHEGDETSFRKCSFPNYMAGFDLEVLRGRYGIADGSAEDESERTVSDIFSYCSEEYSPDFREMKICVLAAIRQVKNELKEKHDIRKVFIDLGMPAPKVVDTPPKKPQKDAPRLFSRKEWIKIQAHKETNLKAEARRKILAQDHCQSIKSVTVDRKKSTRKRAYLVVRCKSGKKYFLEENL